MSASKTSRRAPVRHPKPFKPVTPLTSLVYEGGNFYRQQEYTYQNHNFDVSFSGKCLLLHEIGPRGIKEQALQYELHLNGVFSTEAGLLCDSKEDSNGENVKEGQQYFWNEHLLFVKRKQVDSADPSFSDQKIAVIFKLCICTNCITKPGISFKSLKPIRTELHFSASVLSRDRPQFASIPVTLVPAVLTMSDDVIPNCMKAQAGLIAPQNLVYFTELDPDAALGKLTLNQVVFDQMAAKFIQIFETELVSWSPSPLLIGNMEKGLKLKRNASAAKPPECPLKRVLKPADNSSQSSDSPRRNNASQFINPRKEDNVKDLGDKDLISHMKNLSRADVKGVALKRPTVCLKTMLEEGIGADWEIISTDGKAVKCHMAVLATQVPFFRSLLACGGVSSGGDDVSAAPKILTGLVMPSDTEMDELAVKAFLRFVYYQDTELMKTKFQVCYTMLRAGYSYQLSSLVISAADIIIKESHRLNHLEEWFTVEGLWKLFAFVRDWEESYHMKNKLISTIVDILKILLKKVNRTNGLLKITNGDEPLSDLIYQFLIR